MKAAAAFSIGLWTGAAVLAAVGLFYMQSSNRARSDAASAADSKLVAETEQIRSLEQENARLNAEVERFRETATALKSNLAVQAVVELRRRVPFRRASEDTDPVSDSWVEQAAAGGDATTL